MDVTILHWQVLNLTSRVIRQEYVQRVWLVHKKKSSVAEPLMSDPHIHQNQSGLYQKQQQAEQDWLTALKKSAKDVPLSCFQHLLQQTDHARACLRLEILLLHRSALCRQHFFGDLDLLAWMNNKDRWWQTEAAHGLQDMDARLYPTVSTLLFKLKAPPQEPAQMLDWRRGRDLALEHYERFVPRCRRLLGRAHACFAVLVPDMIHQETDREREQPEESTAAQDMGEESNEDEDVDWEDADEADEQHRQAVERTLQLMTSTSQAIHEGAVHINMDGPTSSETPNDEEREQQAKERLKSICSKLQVNYLSVLAVWVEGLTHSDDLFATNNGSWTVGPTEIIQQCRQVLQGSKELKRDIADVLAKAHRLESPGEVQPTAALNPPTGTRRQVQIRYNLR